MKLLPAWELGDSGNALGKECAYNTVFDDHVRWFEAGWLGLVFVLLSLAPLTGTVGPPLIHRMIEGCNPAGDSNKLET